MELVLCKQLISCVFSWFWLQPQKFPNLWYTVNIVRGEPEQVIMHNVPILLYITLNCASAVFDACIYMSQLSEEVEGW